MSMVSRGLIRAIVLSFKDIHKKLFFRFSAAQIKTGFWFLELERLAITIFMYEL